MYNNIILFGSGAIGMLAYNYFGVNKVKFFVDNNSKKVGQTFCGKKIISFEDLKKYIKQNEDCHIYLTSNLYSNEIAKQLNENGILNYSYFYDFIPDEFQIELLLKEYNVNIDDRIVLIGTSNITDKIYNVVSLLGLKENISDIVDIDYSLLLGKTYLKHTVKKISEYEDEFDVIIVCLPYPMVENEKLIVDSIESNKRKVIIASEAVKFLNEKLNDNKRNLEKIDPKGLINSKRMDIIVRYLLFVNMINNIEDDNIKSLYSKTILLRNGAYEKIGAFSAKSKITVNSHIEAAKELLSSMKENGFVQREYIPVNNDGVVCNGAHRTAAALALKDEVWISKCPALGNEWRFKWFEENAFSNDDKIRILRGFADLYEQCGIFILYGPAFEHWDFIEKYIGSKVNIVGCVDIDFENNFYAFENFINEIYGSFSGKLGIKQKINFLKMSRLRVKIVLVSDENNKSDNIYAVMSNIKLSIRDLLNYDLDNMSFVVIHGSDRESEFNHLKKVCLSVNNLKNIKNRIIRSYRQELLERIEYFKNTCASMNISIDQACIVGGTVLDILGIRESDNDLDFIITNDLRSRFGNNTVHIGKDIDIMQKNYLTSDGVVYLSDDVIINNDNYHFIFNGCKVINLDLLAFRKKNDPRNREKDKADLRLIELYNEFNLFFDEKSTLKEQINKILKK